MATFRSLKPADGGGWGLMGTVTELVPGATVRVTKANGDVVEKVVGEIVWTGPKGEAVATIAGGCAKRGRSQARGRGYRGFRNVAASARFPAPTVTAEPEFDEAAAERRACGIPEPEGKTYNGSDFDVDVADNGDVTLTAEASTLGGGGEPVITISFKNGSKRFKLLVVDRTDNGVPGDGEVAGWRYVPVVRGHQIKSVLIVND